MNFKLNQYHRHQNKLLCTKFDVFVLFYAPTAKVKMFPKVLKFLRFHFSNYKIIYTFTAEVDPFAVEKCSFLLHFLYTSNSPGLLLRFWYSSHSFGIISRNLVPNPYSSTESIFWYCLYFLVHFAFFG
jgi:hypothetical protein